MLTDWQIGAVMVVFALLAGAAAGYGAHQLVDLVHSHSGHCVPQGIARCP